MKKHPASPYALAVHLAEGEPFEDMLQDIRDDPDLYYNDHVDYSEEQGTLPLSDVAWRNTCLASRMAS